METSAETLDQPRRTSSLPVVPPPCRQDDDKSGKGEANFNAQDGGFQQILGEIGCVHGSKLFGHIVACIARREIFEFTKDLVAVLYVKFRRLETEGV